MWLVGLLMYRSQQLVLEELRSQHNERRKRQFLQRFAICTFIRLSNQPQLQVVEETLAALVGKA